MVIDIFAGSNTTGAVAEKLGRKWLAFEQEKKYLAASIFRFVAGDQEKKVKSMFDEIILQNSDALRLESVSQLQLLENGGKYEEKRHKTIRGKS